MRYLIQLSYKGTHFHGWQKQVNVKTVQQELDEKLSLMLGENIETLGCGRTDAGVHAKQFPNPCADQWYSRDNPCVFQ